MSQHYWQDQLSPGWDSGAEGCETALALGCRWRLEESCPELLPVLVPCMLLLGPVLDSYWSKTGDLTPGLRSERLLRDQLSFVGFVCGRLWDNLSSSAHILSVIFFLPLSFLFFMWQRLLNMNEGNIPLHHGLSSWGRVLFPR